MYLLSKPLSRAACQEYFRHELHGLLWDRRARVDRVFGSGDTLRVRLERTATAMLPIAKLANFCKFLAGSFSAVSKRNVARKYAFDSIFLDLTDVHTFAPLQTQHFSKKSVQKQSAIFVTFQQIIYEFCKISRPFKKNQLQNLVDLQEF